MSCKSRDLQAAKSEILKPHSEYHNLVQDIKPFKLDSIQNF